MIFKSLISLLIALLIAFLSGKNLFAQLNNGSFEVIDEKGNAQSWIFNTNQSEGAIVDISNNEKYEGTSSLILRKIQTNKNIYAVQNFKMQTEESGKFKLSAMVKSSSNTPNANLYLNILNDISGEKSFKMHPIILQKGQENSWQKIEFNFLLNEKANKLSLFLNLIGTTEIYFDDIKIEEIKEDASSTIKNFASEILEKVKTKSIVSDSINWTKVEQDLPIALRGLKTEKDHEEVVNTILSYLRKTGDYHSQYYPKEKYDAYKNSPNTISSNQVQNKTELPNGKMIDHQIAYVYVPRFGSTHQESAQSFADTLNQIILNLQKQNPKGWIVDLSRNSGGNMYPMLAGLNALIGEGTIFSMYNKTLDSPVVMQKGKIGSIVLKSIPKHYEESKIAIITSQMTASSGEMTLAAFLGKKNIKTFGLATAGLTTANAFIDLSNGGSISLASAYIKDRTGKSHLGAIKPDIEVRTKTFEELLNVVSKWILEE